MERAGFDERAARNLLAYLQDEAEATGVVPDDRTVVVERFRDEVGDWRVCVLTPPRGRGHAPPSLAPQARPSGRLGVEGQTKYTDDRVAPRLPPPHPPPHAPGPPIDPGGGGGPVG